MLRSRTLLSVLIACATGALLNRYYALPVSDPLSVLVRDKRPELWLAIWWTWTAMLFTTPFWVMSLVLSSGFAMSLKVPRRKRAGPLPRLEPITERNELQIVIGELHHPRRPEPVASPQWLIVPERGLYTGVMILGAIGSGKTSGCMYPYASQVLGWRADLESHKAAGLVLEVKGDFCGQVKRMLEGHGRADDYIGLSPGGAYRYNPLHNDRDAGSLAYSIVQVQQQLYGKSRDPFWPQAYTNLLKNIISLFRSLDEYVTLDQVYRAIADPEWLHERITAAEQALHAKSILITHETWMKAPAGLIDNWQWEADPQLPGWLALPWTETAEAVLREHEIAHSLKEVKSKFLSLPQRRTQLLSVLRWYTGPWSRMDQKLKEAVIAAIGPLLQLFDDNPEAKYTFCPPKAAYDRHRPALYGQVLPPMQQLIEEGKVLALDCPVAANPNLARIIGVLIKQDFQRSMLLRIPDMAAGEEWRVWRPALFLCDEYHCFATCGEDSPDGDEQFFGQSRQAKCIPVVATQSLSSLRSALHDKDTWSTLVSQFRTTILLCLNDKFTAEWASGMCGRQERLRVNYSLGESGSDAKVSMMTGTAVAEKSSLSASKSYSSQKDVIFDPATFLQLKNCQAIALAYDGSSPLPATLVYLKPWYLPAEMGYFEQVRKRLLCSPALKS